MDESSSSLNDYRPYKYDDDMLKTIRCLLLQIPNGVKFQEKYLSIEKYKCKN